MLTLLLSPLVPLALLAGPPAGWKAPRAVVAAETPPPEEIRVGGDRHQLYLLHAPERAQAPKGGWRLLVVLPGGGGGADFAPFVGRIREHALGDGWLVAQMVAPVWDASQAERVVWPTKRLPHEGMRFSTEDFFAAMLADVMERREIDRRHVFTLAWSSSGTAAYTIALEPDSPVTGTFVAMSVFKPELLPSLRNAKGRSFYLLHSPEDFIPIAMARRAQEELRERGGLVHLAEYAGGHGWHGDVYQELQTGVDWLRARVARKPLPRPKRR